MLKALVAVAAVSGQTRVAGTLAAAFVFSGSRLLITYWTPFSEHRSIIAFVVSSMSLVAVAMLVLAIEAVKEALGLEVLDSGSTSERTALAQTAVLWWR